MHATMSSRPADGTVHVHQYSSHSHSQSAYVPIPMNVPSHHHHSYAQQSLTSYGAKHQHDTQSHFSHLGMPMSQSYSTSSMQPPLAPFSSSLPTSLSAPIPVRRHTLPHIAYPEYGREESYDDSHSQSYDGSIQSPGSVQSSNERSFSDGEYDAPSSYPNPGLATPFHGASAVIESGVPYNLHHHQSRGHAQEGSDGSNSGWRTVAANVIDWSGRAHGGHSRDSSSGSTASNMTAIGETQPTSVPYTPGMSRMHSDFPVTPRSAVSGSYYEPELYDHSHIRSYNHASPTGYYEASTSPNYVLSSSYPPHPYRSSFGSPEAISPVTLFGGQHRVVPKSESLSPELPSYPNMWQTRGDDAHGLQEDDDKDSSVDDGDAKSASPGSSLPNTPAAVELALPPVVPSQPFPSDARVDSISPPPHVDFDIQISSNGNVRMPRSCRSTVPVPIPNLTKKSRGRRVPTKPAAIPVTGVGKSARTFTCSVDGCGKCFNRGEHLKRHIRSIHTDEKPHVCPVSKCGKTFSRHDNLCQHMRVHGKFSAPVDGGLEDY